MEKSFITLGSGLLMIHKPSLRVQRGITTYKGKAKSEIEIALPLSLPR